MKTSKSRQWTCTSTSKGYVYRNVGLLPSDLVAQSVERRRSNPKGVGSIPTLVRVFLCPCVGPFPLGLTLTWFIWDRGVAFGITLYSVNSVHHIKSCSYIELGVHVLILVNTGNVCPDISFIRHKIISAIGCLV